MGLGAGGQTKKEAAGASESGDWGPLGLSNGCQGKCTQLAGEDLGSTEASVSIGGGSAVGEDGGRGAVSFLACMPVFLAGKLSYPPRPTHGLTPTPTMAQTLPFSKTSFLTGSLEVSALDPLPPGAVSSGHRRS